MEIITSLRNSKLTEIILIIIVFMSLFFVFKNEKTQDPIWFVPYLSGAENLSSDGVWRYSEEELQEIRNSEDKNIIYDYEFKTYPKEKLSVNKYNAIGYLYIVKLASVLFGCLPMVKAVQAFQVLLHLLMSFIIYFLFKNRNSKLLFLGLYLFNPIIIYLSSYPFYYFYQVVPTFFIILLYKKKMHPYILYFAFAVIGFMLNVRMTMLFAAILASVLLFRNYKFKFAFFAFFIMVFSFCITKSSQTATSRWHTTYVGIGAYSNDYLSKLSDESGVELYELKTNKKIVPILQSSKEYIGEYNNICKKEYFRILRESPFLIFKNSVLNVLQSYSIGHLANRGMFVNLLSAILGLFIILWLLFKRKYWFVISIGLLTAAFTPYFPPVQQYMFGSYLLIVVAIIDSFKFKDL